MIMCESTNVLTSFDRILVAQTRTFRVLRPHLQDTLDSDIILFTCTLTHFLTLHNHTQNT